LSVVAEGISVSRHAFKSACALLKNDAEGGCAVNAGSVGTFGGVQGCVGGV
jgi:hypothetical protein